MTNKYAFKKYSKRFPAIFKKEKEKLKKILTKDSKVFHIGSTAVLNLGGKGITDILIKTNKIKTNKKALEKNYDFIKEAGSKESLA